jgi:hypothetical protein
MRTARAPAHRDALAFRKDVFDLDVDVRQRAEDICGPPARRLRSMRATRR